MLGSMATVPLTPDFAAGPTSPLYTDPLQEQLLGQYEIEVPVFSWPSAPRRWVRISAQLYNVAAHYERLAQALRQLV